jgi:hypothetical protein
MHMLDKVFYIFTVLLSLQSVVRRKDWHQRHCRVRWKLLDRRAKRRVHFKGLSSLMPTSIVLLAVYKKGVSRGKVHVPDWPLAHLGNSTVYRNFFPFFVFFLNPVCGCEKEGTYQVPIAKIQVPRSLGSLHLHEASELCGWTVHLIEGR